MQKRALVLLFLIISFPLLQAQEVDIQLYQKIPMRDGVHLSANIYMPTERPEPLPVILIYTPYVNDEANDRGMFFAQQGYVFISLDLRGRGNSEGDYAPFEKDGIDGYDAIEWISQQPWCNGKVGMMGGSYRGMVQWLTLKQKPKALVSMVPTASVGPGIDFPKSNGIFGNYALQWLTFTSGRSRNDNMFGNGGYWYAKSLKKYKEHLAFREWDMIALGDRNEVFQKWIAHPDFDEYWQGIYPTRADYASFDLPILSITGYFDGDQPGAMTYYEGHMANASASAKEQHYLILGPWNHPGTRNPVTELGGFKFGADSKLDMLDLHLQWFDWTLKGKEKPTFLKDRVAYYLMESNEWKYTNSYENTATESIQYYLSSQETEADHFLKAGQLLTEPAPKQSPDTYTYDPLDTASTPFYSGQDYYTSPDPGYIGKNNLVYLGEPLEEDTELFGRIELGAYLEMDVEDTDISAAVYEKTETGETLFLGNDAIRARYRNSLEKAELVKPGEVNLYTFDSFFITARTLKKGSRLFVVISSYGGSFNQLNYNSGKDVSDQTGADAKVAHVKLHLSKKYPSYLKIPVVKE